MTVRDLIDSLSGVPLDAEVILQKDPEGNGYSPLAGVFTTCIYSPETTWGGEIKDTDWTADEACADEDDWEEFKKRPRCLLLYPIN